MKSVVFVSAVLPLAASSALTDVWVAPFNDSCKYRVKTAGVTGNLNERISHGVELRLCYDKTDGKPITGLMVFKSGSENDWKSGLCESHYSPIQYRGNVNGDLNQGKHGKYETLCQRNDGSLGLADLQLQDTTNCPSGWEIVAGRTGNPDLNEHGHSDGKRLYLCAKYEQPAPAPAPKPECTASDIQGFWAYKYTIATLTDESWTHGTNKGHSESKSDSWSDSVSDAVTHGKMTKGMRHSKQSTVSSSHAQTMSDNYSKEWSANDAHTFTVHFTEEDRGKAAWHWVFEINDDCNHLETSETQELAITPRQSEQPCCLPGYSYDAPAYTRCVDEDSKLLDDDDRCSVGKSPSPSPSRRRRRRRKSLKMRKEVVV
jgi:hypothetical protein